LDGRGAQCKTYDASSAKGGEILPVGGGGKDIPGAEEKNRMSFRLRGLQALVEKRASIAGLEGKGGEKGRRVQKTFTGEKKF